MTYSFPINEFVTIENLKQHNGSFSFPEKAIQNYLTSFKFDFKKRTFSPEGMIISHIVKGSEKTIELIQKVKEWKQKESNIDDEKDYELNIRIEQLRGLEKAYGLREDEEKELKEYVAYTEKCKNIRLNVSKYEKALDSHFNKLKRNNTTNLIVSKYAQLV